MNFNIMILFFTLFMLNPLGRVVHTWWEFIFLSPPTLSNSVAQKQSKITAKQTYGKVYSVPRGFTGGGFVRPTFVSTFYRRKF